jgi:hypothetical protein
MLVIGDVVEIEEFAYGYDDQGNYYTDILVWRARVIETPEPSVYPQPRDEVLIYTEHGNYWAGVQERITVLSQV